MGHAPIDATVQNLLQAREQFVRFLIPRMRSREAAEDLVQASLLKVLQSQARPRDSESSVAWFYQLLRNALVDHIRAHHAEARALERHGGEEELVDDPELERVACACIQALLPTLKETEAEVLQAVDLGGETPGAFAARKGVTANAMTVRLHRARKSLREKVERTCRTCAAHGCLDCRCGKAAAGS
ncbi:MAG: sigma-70 family RNA polymerase sigma factor [Holophagaceae bacterium]|nr:sigma-70 family RNA polymerase sigma factor [Holophagaceae bacterium]